MFSGCRFSPIVPATVGGGGLGCQMTSTVRPPRVPPVSFTFLILFLSSHDVSPRLTACTMFGVPLRPDGASGLLGLVFALPSRSQATGLAVSPGVMSRARGAVLARFPGMGAGAP